MICFTIWLYISGYDLIYHNFTLHITVWVVWVISHLDFVLFDYISLGDFILFWLYLKLWLKYRHRNSLTVANDFHSIDKCYGSQWLPSTIWSPAFFRISFLCVIEGINSYRFGTTWGGVEDDRFNFWVNYAFIISQFDFVSHSLMLSHILTWYRAIFISKSHNVL